MTFKNDIEVLKLANNVKYGLSASVWTSNLKRTMYFSQQLNVGSVWINTWMERDLRTPFGGVKESGFGREGGSLGILDYLVPKYTKFKIY